MLLLFKNKPHICFLQRKHIHNNLKYYQFATLHTFHPQKTTSNYIFLSQKLYLCIQIAF